MGHAAVWGSISFCPKRRHTPLLRLTRTLGRMNTTRRIRAVATLVLLLLSACATPLSKTSRVHLGGPSFLELEIPAGWEIRVAYGPKGKVEQVRVFRETTEVMQIVPLNWRSQRSESEVSKSQMRNTAFSSLRDRGLCKDLTLEERSLAHGVAAYCARPVSNSRTVGVWISGQITTEFSVLNPPDTIEPELWKVLGSVRHFSF